MSQSASQVKILHQFKAVLPLHEKAYQFAKKNKVWNGLFKIKWIVITGVCLSALISYRFISLFTDWFSDIFRSEVEVTAVQSATMLFGNMSEFGSDLFISGSYKYMILIFVEIIIFYCVVNTLNIIRNQNFRPQFKDFAKAQKRMVLVGIRAWSQEIIVSYIIGLLLGIIGFSFLKAPTVLLIQFYFIGVLFLDNYTEQFGITIKDSFTIIRSHSGAAIGIGLVAYVLFLIPLVGLIVAPILGGITAALYMGSQNIHLEHEMLFSLDESNYEFV